MPPAASAPEPARRRAIRWALGAGAGVLLALIAYWFFTAGLPALRFAREHPWVRQCMAQAPASRASSYFIPPIRSPDGRYCLSAPSADASTRDAPEGGRSFAAVRDLRSIEVWDSHARRYQVLAGHTGRVRCFALSPPWLLTASDDTQDPEVRLWSLENGALVRTFAAPYNACWGGFAFMGFTPDQRLAVTATVDQRVRVWDAATGQQVGALTPGVGPTVFAFSADGALLALGEFPGDISLWDWRGGKLLRRWPAHDRFGALLPESGGVEQLAFSADGARLRSRGPRGGSDMTVEWDAATGRLLSP